MDEILQRIARLHRELEQSGRSFDRVHYKLDETRFFLNQLIASDFQNAHFYFSAYLSAARSVTFSLQSVMSRVDGFEGWYAEEQRVMREDPRARYFLDRRNNSEKVGERAIFSIGLVHQTEPEFSFLLWPEMNGNSVVELIPEARLHTSNLESLVSRCYARFAQEVDPNFYFVRENIERVGLTVEDIEELLGFPRGWTHLGQDEDEIDTRLRLLSRSTSPNILINLLPWPEDAQT